MQTVIKLLKKELREWKDKQSSDKSYYKGFYDDKNAIRNFKENKNHIKELKQAIDILVSKK